MTTSPVPAYPPPTAAYPPPPAAPVYPAPLAPVYPAPTAAYPPPAPYGAVVPATGVVASQNLYARATRELNAPLATTRGALVTAIRQQRLTFDVDQLSLLEAHRGSRLGGLTLSPQRVPLAVRVDLTAAGGDASRVEIVIEDRWGIPVGRNWGAVAAYRTAFATVSAAIDQALTALDRQAAERFDEWQQHIGADVGALAGAAERAAQAEGAVSRQADKLFQINQGPRAASEGLGTISLTCENQTVQLMPDELDGILTAGQAIASRPGQLPAHLAAQVQELVIAFEGQLEQVRSFRGGPTPPLRLEPAQIPVLTFCYQQSRIRERLPLRLLLTCTTCRLPKVENPDFTVLRERSRRNRALTSSVGAVFGTHGITPYIMLGRLVQARSGEPSFVCQRCQGLDADQTVVTYCPRCAERRDEAVLRTCQKCSYDFRGVAREAPEWLATEPPAAVAAPPPPPALAGPAG